MTQELDDRYVEIDAVKKKLDSVKLPQELYEKASLMIERARVAIKYGGYFAGIEQVENYVDLIIDLPWFTRSDDTVDMAKASALLDKNHFGLKEVKARILEYLAVLKLSKTATINTEDIIDPAVRAPILLLIGLVGTGKTTLAFSIAEAMGRKFIRIPFGGLGSAQELRGQSRMHPDAEPGFIIRALHRARTKNPVILFDEVDRVTEQARADIMGVLVEVMDPEQNSAFTDHYLDYHFDLSEVLFIATSNNTANIAQAVLDRFEQIRMPSYSDKDKIEIAKNFLLPKILRASGITANQLTIQDAAWPGIIRPIGYDAGMRTLERTIIGICRKVALLVIEGKGQNFVITPENIRDFLHSDVNLY